MLVRGRERWVESGRRWPNVEKWSSNEKQKLFFLLEIEERRSERKEKRRKSPESKEKKTI
jgi:hypothetical protein